MFLINKKITSLVRESTCSIYIGDRGSGKSTLMALTADYYSSIGYNCYSNYPTHGCYAIPTVTVTDCKKGTQKVYFDKDFLYSTDLSHSLILIDEARTVWNARAYKDWNEQDEEFFNFIRKNDTFVVLATQRYDGIDLNIRCAADYTFFIQQSKFFKNWSTIDVSRSCQVKIADRNTQIVSRGYTRGAQKVIWDIAEMPLAYCRFYRKPFYGKFDTYYSTQNKEVRDPVPWSDLLAPDELKDVL